MTCETCCREADPAAFSPLQCSQSWWEMLENCNMIAQSDPLASLDPDVRRLIEDWP